MKVLCLSLLVVCLTWVDCAPTFVGHQCDFFENAVCSLNVTNQTCDCVCLDGFVPRADSKGCHSPNQKSHLGVGEDNQPTTVYLDIKAWSLLFWFFAMLLFVLCCCRPSDRLDVYNHLKSKKNSLMVVSRKEFKSDVKLADDQHFELSSLKNSQESDSINSQ